MKITYTTFETAYNRHIRLARIAAKGFSGYERAEVIKSYFDKSEHPHAQHTFDQMAMNRSSDKQFAIELMQSMADLCAKNEQGNVLTGVDGRWHFEKLVGGISFNDASVNRYSQNGANSKQLITVEYDNKVHGYMVFDNIDSYSKWVDELMKPFQDDGLTMMYQIASKLDVNWTSESKEY